jgi:hypothetical protein
LSIAASFPMVTDKQDMEKAHWFMDIHESPRRKTRVSYIMYNTKNPFASTYVQMKLFTRNKVEDDFVRKTQVNYTLDEFQLFCNASAAINNELKKKQSH